jgi:hypothetical protein
LATLTGACVVALGPSIAGTLTFMFLQGCAEMQVFKHIFINHAGKSDFGGDLFLRISFPIFVFYGWGRGVVGVAEKQVFDSWTKTHRCQEVFMLLRISERFKWGLSPAKDVTMLWVCLQCLEHCLQLLNSCLQVSQRNYRVGLLNLVFVVTCRIDTFSRLGLITQLPAV